MDEVEENQVVVIDIFFSKKNNLKGIYAEGKEHALAIGTALISTKKMYYSLLKDLIYYFN